MLYILAHILSGDLDGVNVTYICFKWLSTVLAVMNHAITTSTRKKADAIQIQTSYNVTLSWGFDLRLSKTIKGAWYLRNSALQSTVELT